MAQNAPSAFEAFIEWSQDKTRKTEIHDILEFYTNLALKNEDLAISIIEMPFLSELTQVDVEALGWELLQLAEGAPAAFQSFVEWIGNGIGRKDEASKVLPPYTYLALIDQQKEQIAIASLDWAKPDGIWSLLDMAENAPSAFEAFIEWGKDKTRKTEIHAILEFYTNIALENEDLAISIIEMPFLSEVTRVDVEALGSLKDLTSLMNAPDGRNYLEWTLSHPTLEGGITDSHALVVAYLYGMTDIQRSMAEILLDPAQTKVEERLISLPLAGEMRLAVIRHGVRSPNEEESLAMKFLEHAVRVQEEFMGAPFPHPHAVVLLSDVHPRGGRGGPDGMAIASRENLGLIAHEIAHTYWWDALTPFAWIEEGAATFLERISVQAYQGISPLSFHQESVCNLATNLADLERLASELKREVIYQSACSYTLGDVIFKDLYVLLGDEAFRRGFKNLYYTINLDIYFMIGEIDAAMAVRDDACPGKDKTICHLRLAFTVDATSEQAAIVEEVLARRYYGVEP